MAKANRSVARKRRHKRVRKHISGSPERPRLNVYRSLNEIYAQVIDDENGRTLVSASSIDRKMRSEMAEKTKLEQARLVGEILARRAIDKGVSKVVFDRGGFRYRGRVKALADSARKGGLEF